MRGRKRKLDIDEAAIRAFDWFAVRATQAKRRVLQAGDVNGEALPTRWAFLVQLRLEQRGFVTFLPANGVHRFANGYAVVRRAKEVRPAPIYPGWVFVGIEPGANRWRDLQETPGVFGVLGDDGRPWPIPGAAMTRMFVDHGAALKAEERERFMRSRKEYRPGSEARVVDGAFAGSLVKVVEVRGRSARILLSLFGADRETTVDTMMLEAA